MSSASDGQPVTGRSQSPRFEDVAKSRVHIWLRSSFGPTTTNSAVFTGISTSTQSPAKTSHTTDSSMPRLMHLARLLFSASTGSQSIASNSSRFSGLLFFGIVAVGGLRNRHHLDSTNVVAGQRVSGNGQHEPIVARS